MGLFERHISPAIGTKPIGDVTLSELHRLQIGPTCAGKYRTAELVTILVKSLYRYAAKVYRAEVCAGALMLLEIDDLDTIRRPPGARHKAGELCTLEQVGAFLDLAERRYNALPARSSTRCFTPPLPPVLDAVNSSA